MSIFPFRGICPVCGHDHDKVAFEYQQLRKAVSEFQRTRCTCGVSTTLGVVHRADAPCFHFTEHVEFKCRAQKTDPPQDCDWPLCACDPHAESVIKALDDRGAAIVNKVPASVEREGKDGYEGFGTAKDIP